MLKMSKVSVYCKGLALKDFVNGRSRTPKFIVWGNQLRWWGLGWFALTRKINLLFWNGPVTQDAEYHQASSTLRYGAWG
jgi:hypothetical protein